MNPPDTATFLEQMRDARGLRAAAAHRPAWRVQDADARFT